MRPPDVPRGVRLHYLHGMNVPAQPDLLVRYRADGVTHWGLDRGDHLERWTDAPWSGGRPSGPHDPASAMRLVPCLPGKIICIGLNYIEHVKESVTVLPGTTEIGRAHA